MSARELVEKWRREADALHDEAMIGVLTACADELESSLAPAAEAVAPDGYHYVYSDPFGRGETIVQNGGGEWNGQKPKRALPYYYTPPAQQGEVERLRKALRKIDERLEGLSADTCVGFKTVTDDDLDGLSRIATEALAASAKALAEGVDRG